MFTPPTSLPDMTLNKELSLLPVPFFLDNSPHSDLSLRPSDGGFVQAWSPEPPTERSVLFHVLLAPVMCKLAKNKTADNERRKD